MLPASPLSWLQILITGDTSCHQYNQTFFPMRNFWFLIEKLFSIFLNKIENKNCLTYSFTRINVCISFYVFWSFFILYMHFNVFVVNKKKRNDYICIVTQNMWRQERKVTSVKKNIQIRYIIIDREREKIDDRLDDFYICEMNKSHIKQTMMIWIK